MRILGVITSTEIGGGEFASVGALQSMRDRGHEVALATNLTDMVPADWAIRIDTGGKLSRKKPLETLASVPRTIRSVAAAIRQFGRPDVLVTFFKKEQLFTALVPTRGKRVWMEWGPLPIRLRSGLPKYAYLTAAKRTSRILAVSDGTKRSLIEIGIDPGRIEVIPPLVDSAAFAGTWPERGVLRAKWRAQLGLDDTQFALIALTRLNLAKRVDVAIRAVASLPESVVLVIAGVGPDEDALRTLAEESGAGDRVRFVRAPKEGVHEFMHAFDAQIFAPQPQEGLPIAIMCGRLAGLPLVVTAPSGIEQDIGMESAIAAARPHDVEATSAAIAAYADSEELRSAHSAGARTWGVDHFDADRVAQRIESALTLVVNGR